MIYQEPYSSYLNSSAFLAPLGIPEGTVLSFSLLGQGEYNLNYVFTHPVTGQKLVLRINRGSQMHLDDQIGYEFSALEALVPSGRTPEPLLCCRELGLLVMQWLPGRALDYRQDMPVAAAPVCDDVDTPEDLRRLAAQCAPDSFTGQYLQQLKQEGICL